MQSFKEFLKESGQNDIQLVINFQYSAGVRAPTEYSGLEDHLVDELNKLDLPKTLKVGLGSGGSEDVAPGINMQLEKSYTKAELMQIAKIAYDKFIEITQLELDEQALESWNPTVLIKAFNAPNLKIEARNVIFNCEKPTSLHNIHKCFSASESFLIYATENIKSDILGLMLLKGQHARFLEKRANLPEKTLAWINIINDAIRANTDIFDVQDQLVEAGLSEYANL